jgi:16S rRNA (guanine1207-N2)-methyltransferase
MLRASNWLEIPEIGPEDRVLDLGAAGRSIALSGARYDTGTFLTSDIRLYEAACKGGIQAELISGFPEVDDVACAVYEPPQRESKTRVFELLDGAFRALKIGGSCWIAGRKNRGVESYRNRLKDTFGNASHVGRAGRTRVYRAIKEASQPLLPPVDPFETYQALVRGTEELTFECRAGVFSADDFDPGSRLLVDTVGSIDSGSVLDVGCGAGVIGISLVSGKSVARLAMVDSSALAIWCAERNVAGNDLSSRSEVNVGNLYGPYADRRFDLIVSNPPFHEGSAVSLPLIEGAPLHLTESGRLVLVVMRADPYLRALENHFAEVEVVSRDGPYSILSATTPVGQDPPRSPSQ